MLGEGGEMGAVETRVICPEVTRTWPEGIMEVPVKMRMSERMKVVGDIVGVFYLQCDNHAEHFIQRLALNLFSLITRCDLDLGI